MIQWLFSQGNAPAQNEIQDALETLLSATPDQYQKLLEAQLHILLAENTLITLCLTILQYQETTDFATISALLMIFCLLDYAKAHSIAEACAYTSDNTELELPTVPASRMIALLTNAREHIEETNHQQIWGRLHSALGDYYVTIAQEQPAEEQSTSLAQAISCYNIALPILTEDTSPSEYVVIQFQLFALYSQTGEMEQAQRALLKARGITSTWVEMQDQQQPVSTGEPEEVVDIEETLTSTLNTFLEVPYGDALHSCLQEHQAVLQSKQARVQLRKLIAEIAPTNMDGRTEYLTVRLQLLEALYAFDLERAWSIFLTELAHTSQLVQKILDTGSNSAQIEKMLQNQKETFITTSVLAFFHSSLINARSTNNAFVASITEMTIKAMKIMRQQQIPPSSQTITEQASQSQNIPFNIVIPEQIQQQMTTFLQQDGFNDPYFMHILQESQHLGPAYLQQMLPLFAQIGQTKNIDASGMAHILAQPWLKSLDRQTAPYLWATALLMQCMVYLEKPRYDYQQVLHDCDMVLEILQPTEAPDMWVSTMVVRSVVELSFLMEEDTKLTVAEKRLRVEQAIEDLTAALSVRVNNIFPLIPALATATRGLSYMELELYGKPNAQLLEQAEADFAASLPLLQQGGTLFQWNRIFLQRAKLYYRLMQKNLPEMFQQAIADCNEVIESCQPPHSQEIAELWSSAHMIRGLVYMNYVDKGSSRRANFEQAIADFNTVINATKNVDKEEWGRALVNRGHVYSQRVEGDRSQNMEHALKDFTQALPVLREQRFPSEWAALLIGRGNCYAERQAYDRARNQELALQDFNAVLTSIPEEDWAATIRAYAFTGRGNVYLRRLAGEPGTNLPLAIADYSKALALFTPDVQAIWRASVLINRGTANRTLAVSFSLAQRGKGFRAMLPQVLTSDGLHTPAFFQEMQRHFNLAFQDFDQALTILTRSATPLEWARTYGERAMTHACMIYRAFGESRKVHLRQAIDNYSTALLALTPEKYPLDWAFTLSNRAILYRESIVDKNSQEALLALADADAAMTIFTRQVAPAHYRRLQHICAAVFEIIEDWSKADKALQSIRQVQRDLIATASNATDSLDLVAEFALANTYIHHAQIMLRLPDLDLREVVLALEEGRAQMLRSGLDLDTIRPETVRQPDAQARIDAFVAARNQWRRCQHHMLEPLSNLSEAALEKERRRLALEQAYRAFLQTRKAIQEHDDPTFMTSLPRFPAITAAIEDPSMALVYLVPEDSLDQRRGMAIIVTLDLRGTPQVRHLPLPELADLALFDLFDIEGDTSPQIRSEDAINQLGRLGLQRVADALWESGIRRIMCIAYGWSGAFPIPATLIKLADGSTVAMNKRFEMTMVPSVLTATAAREYLHSPKKQRRMLLFAGNPQPLSEQAPDLPGAEAEAQTLRRIARRYGHPTAHICHLSRNTVVKSRLTEVLELARYAHLALHGRYNVEQPRASRLLLARQGQPEEAYITLGEILDQTFDLKGLRLLILSACETSTIDMRRTPDEVLGIAAGFQKAGVATIIATLWPVDDEATYLLMSRFAQLYLDPQNLWTPARALGEAQHWLRTEATNKVLEEYDPFPARTALRSVRHSYANMVTTIRLKASRDDPAAIPYRDAFYWAGFVAIGY